MLDQGTRVVVITAIACGAWLAVATGCPGQSQSSTANAPAAASAAAASAKPSTHYVEIVTNDVDALTNLYTRLHGLTFSAPDADLGQARVATQKDGTLVGIRKPLAEHESAIMRTYVVVDDIQLAVKNAEANGATVAYAPTRQGQRGTFAIVIQGNVEHGLWAP